MMRLGSCVLAVNPDSHKGTGIEIRDPEFVLRAFEMENGGSLANIFDKWFPIGLIRDTRELIALDVSESTDTVAFGREGSLNWNKFDLLPSRKMSLCEWLNDIVATISIV